MGKVEAANFRVFHFSGKAYWVFHFPVLLLVLLHFAEIIAYFDNLSGVKPDPGLSFLS